MTVYAGGTGLNTRLLTTNDQLTLPQLTPVIINDDGVTCINVKVNSMPPIVIPPITISSVSITDTNGNDILSNTSGYLQTQIMNSSLTVNTISGYATSANQVTAQASLNSLVTGTRILSSNGNSITVDGSGYLNVNVKNSSLNVNTGLTMIYINNESLNVDTGLTMIHINNESLNVDTGLTMIYINNESLNVDTGLTMIHINNETLNVDTGLTMIHINNESLNVDTGLTMIHINNETLNVSLDCDTIVLTQTGDIAGKSALVTASSMYAYSAESGIVENITFSNASYITNEAVKNRLDVSTVLIDATNDLKIQIAPINSVLLNGTNGLICSSVICATKDNDETSRLLMTDDSRLKVDTGLTMIHINNETLNVDTGLTMIYINNDSITVDGSVTVNLISGYATETTLEELNIKINNDLVLTDAIQVSIKNTSLAVTGSVTIPGGVDVNTLPYITADNNSITVVGVDGTGTERVLLTDATGKLQVNSNLITGFALETTQTSIKNQTDKLQFTTTTNYLQTAVENTVDVKNTSTNSLYVQPNTTYGIANTFKNSVYDSAGSAITSRVPITNVKSLDTSSILYGKSGASSIDAITTTLNAARQELDVNMEKTDVHLYAKKPVSGNAMEILTSDSHGHLAIRIANEDNSKYNTFDTDNGLNVHVTNTSLPISITDVTSKIEDSAGNDITSLTTPSNCVGALKTALYGTVTNNAIGDTAASPHGTTKTGLNNFIVNSYTLPVICGGYDGTNTQGFKTTSLGSQYVALDTNNNTIKIGSTDNTVGLSTTANTIKIGSSDNTIQFSQTSNQNNIKITDTGSNIATISTPSLPSGVSSIRGLDTQACVNALDVYNNTYANVTLTPAASGPNAGYKALDVYARNPTTTNDYTRVGLNTYQIYPKKIYCQFSGFNANATTNQLYGGAYSTTLSPSSINFNANTTLYYWGFNGATTTRKLYFTYVDLSNTIQTTSVILNTNTYTPLLGVVGTPIGMRSLLKLEATDFMPITGSSRIDILAQPTTATPSTLVNCIAGITYFNTFNGVIVVPNGYIGYLQGFNFYASASTTFNYTKYYNGSDQGTYTGITGRTTMASWTNNTNLTVGNGGGIIGHIVNAGEGVFMWKQTASTDTYFYGTFVLEAV